MRLGIGAILSLIAVGCAGCASQPATLIVSAVAPGQAKVVITRSDDGPYIGPAATVHVGVNGTDVVSLAAGQTYTGGVKPGPVTLTASEVLDIGQYTLRFDAVAGKTYKFLLSRRPVHMMAGVFGGLAGMVVETIVSGEQSGDYKITPVQ
jgi:hypothetical protein